jgi:prepilin-type N-terminal cleavage/methylation domain-containing protein
MSLSRLSSVAARQSNRGGFTLVELLVVIGIIAILAGVALGPITRGITQAKESASMQVARQIGLLEFAYSNDYSQVYPYETSAELIADDLLNNGYTSDPSIFYLSGTPGAVKGVGTTGKYTLAKTAVCWDFICNTGATTPTGLTSNSADGTPLVFITGNAITMATTGPIDLTVTGSQNAFGTDGVAVSYKSNSAQFFKAAITGAGTAKCTAFVSSSFNDTNGASYSQIKP